MKPIICVPMGDAAGVGPEILMASLADSVVRDTARVVAIGHEGVLRRAAEVMGVSMPINRVDDTLSGVKEGVCNLVPVGAIQLDAFAYGKVSAMCGQASFDCIKKSV